MLLVEDTRKTIRKHTIKMLFDAYEGGQLNLSKEKRAIKYAKMKKSPFHFYRGSAVLFYEDLTKLPLPYQTTDEHPTWIQGDLHFENFGAFQAKDGQIVFDINDFDEGFLGSYLYDIIRNSVSIGLYAEMLGYSEENQSELMERFYQYYAKQLQTFADRSHAVKTLFNKEATYGPVKNLLENVEGKKPNEALLKMTIVENGKRRFKRGNGLESLDLKERQALEEAWNQYLDTLDQTNRQGRAYFRIKDVVKSFGAGIGSVGLNRYFILIEGDDDDNQEDDVILEAKEARQPVTAHFFPAHPVFTEEGEGIHHGKRVVMTQKAMHHLEDPYLGWMTVQGRHYYVRENSSYQDELDRDHLKHFASILATVEIMGQVTAKAHARADRDVHDKIEHQNEQAILNAIGDDFDRFAKDLTRLALYYKKQVCADYRLFVEWITEEYECGFSA